MSVAQFEYTGKTLYDKYLIQSEISCMKAWHARCFRENNNGGSKGEYKSEHENAIKVFQDANLILYTVTNIHPKAKPGFH